MSFDPDDIWVDAIKGFNHVPQQKKRRLYRIAVVCAVGTSYLIDTVLLFFFYLAGTIQVEAPLYYGLAGLFHVLLFSMLHWSGVSEGLQNHHMTMWQMAYGICVQLLGITLAPQLSPFFLGLMFVIFAFGTLRISFHEALTVWLVSTLAIAMTIFTKGANLTLMRGSLIEYILVAISFSLILLRTIALGYYASVLRTYIFKRSQSFERKATHDALTGVFNRWVLDGILNEQFSLFTRKGIPCSLAMIDIDHFKQVNDSYGHNIGDEILKAIVEEIRSEIRDSDKIVRYGGEEFILIMAATNLDEAIVLAERVRSRISHMRRQELPDESQVTVSIGLASMTETDKAETPLTRADAALYKAKRLGRNRVVI